ncbi:hypothetical protein [Nostoc sp. CALU 1950]|uniref:hypothetical protein n=1 Tax=Nostoc sp. CALU 1950 TaxID=3104321 RepID=UPI003EB9BB8A
MDPVWLTKSKRDYWLVLVVIQYREVQQWSDSLGHKQIIRELLSQLSIEDLS